jgi:hypothetical protein
MKKNYVSPEIKVVKSTREGVILMHSQDWGDAKQNNFFEEDDVDNIKSNNLWDDDPFGE